MNQKKDKRILVALDIAHQSGREHLDGFYRHADRKGNWEVRFVPSTEESYAPMVREFVARGIDGVVVKGECTSSVADAIFSAGVPVVAIDRSKSPTPHKADIYIVNDNERIGREAARYFDTLGRFAAYGFVPDPYDCEWSRIRGRAFLDTVARQHPDAAIETFSIAAADGANPVPPLAESLMLPSLAQWLAAMPKPAAVFAAFDQCAATVLETCRELRIDVPKEISVVGVDDDSLVCEHTRPKLTSIHPDHERQGYVAAQELDGLMSRRRRKNDVVVISYIGITVRDSTTYVPQGMRIVRDANAYLNGHALSPIRVADVVSHLGVSERLANRRYSQIVGHSIQEEIVFRRLAEARRLLAKTNMPMSRIAERCGFKSQIVLAHLFSKRIGMSMSAYRAGCPSSSS